MDSSDLAYIIPPYLLNTCLGSKLQKIISSKDPQLSLSNVISTKSFSYSKKYNDKKIPKYQYSSDPIVNQLIKEKLVYKLSIIGVLGSNPMENPIDDAYLFELFEMFKHRLLHDDNVDNRNDETGYESTSKSRKSVFDSSTVGETNFLFSSNKRLSKDYTNFPNNTLRHLLLTSKFDTYHQYRVPPSFVKFSDGQFFNYPLPLTWSPLVPNNYLRYLQDDLNLKISSDDGYSTISLSTLSTNDLLSIDSMNELIPKKKYYNFICDKPVSPAIGVFYYEMEVNQECTESTNFLPILQTNDSSISSNIVMNICMGFTRQCVNYESTSESAGSTEKDYLNLDNVKDDILINDENSLLNSLLNEDVREMICCQPGEFRGSFAVNFEDLSFYNSIKISEATSRHAALSMNRRLSSLNRQNADDDNGKIDMGIPFDTYMSNETPNKKSYKTDVIGCGINFINKSVFFTLNGVLVKTISNDDLASKQMLNDHVNLFADYNQDDNSAICPIVGFKVQDLKEKNAKLDPTTLKIKTNLGFKEFKFNIENYVTEFRNENQKFMYLSLLDKIQNIKSSNIEIDHIEKSLLNIDDDSKFVNKLIKGYLNHEGYLETFNSFSSDLNSLSTEISAKQNLDEEADSIVLKKSHALNRQIIKNYILKNQFDLALKFIAMNYADLFALDKGKDIIFEVKKFQFVYLLKKYLEVKLNLNNYEFEFEFNNSESEQELFNKAYEYGKLLQEEYQSDGEKLRSIQEISSAFIVNSQESLRNLPKVDNLLSNYTKGLSYLSNEINNKILDHLGLNKSSNLEQIFNHVDDRINNLSLKYNDEKFMLVNLERDHMDI